MRIEGLTGRKHPDGPLCRIVGISCHAVIKDSCEITSEVVPVVVPDHIEEALGGWLRKEQPKDCLHGMAVPAVKVEPLDQLRDSLLKTSIKGFKDALCRERGPGVQRRICLEKAYGVKYYDVLAIYTMLLAGEPWSCLWRSGCQALPQGTAVPSPLNTAALYSAPNSGALSPFRQAVTSDRDR